MIFKVMLSTILLSLFGGRDYKNPARWSEGRVDRWFQKGIWHQGWTISPDPSIDRRALAVSYFNHPARWEAAFQFLKSHDLVTLEPGRYEIDGDKLFALVSEYTTKDQEGSYYEAHRKYIDLQYIIQGKEFIGIGPLHSQLDTVEQYDPSRDIEFFSVREPKNFEATPDRFFIFFPSDAHRPQLKDGISSPVKKIVIKLMVE